MKKLNYTQNGDYLIPDLVYLETKATYGKYGMMREDYLKNHRKGLWNRIILQKTLIPHLNEIDQVARERIERMLPQLMRDAGVTEELRASDQLRWVGLINCCKEQAEEVILAELVYA